MGLGSFAAGHGPAGVGFPSQPERVIPPELEAAYYDPKTRTLPFDANGAVQTVHPVDQEMAFALTIAQGMLASAVEVGLDRDRTRKPIARAAIPAMAEDVVRVAAKRPLERGDVEIRLVEVDSAVRGRLAIRTTYVNLRLPGSQPRTVP